MFNDRIHSFQEKDSLEDESQRQNFGNPFYDKQEDNYEFLYDEEYQSLKQWKDKQLENKWFSMIQNLSLNFQLRETWSDLDFMNQYLKRSQNLQEFIIKEDSLSQFSFREMEQGSQPKKRRYQMNLNMWELKEEIQSQSELMMKQVEDIMLNEKGLLRKLQEERESNDALRLELEETKAKEQQYQQYYSFSKDKEENDDLQQESYIEEVETQLQEARAQLLEKKCQMADKDEENKVLKSELIKMNENLTKVEEEKRDLDSLVIKVSQELKQRDMTQHLETSMPEFSKKDFKENTQQSLFQLTSEKDHLNRQIELLKKELNEHKGKHNNLEMIEGDLLYKLQTRETELTKSRNYIEEIEEKLELKTEAIEKAKKVIEKLNDDLDTVTSQLIQVEQERDSMRKEGKGYQRKIGDLNKSLDQQQIHHHTSTQQVNHQLKREVDELKIALKQYQQEFEIEKRQLTDTVRNLNEQKYQITMEKNKIEIDFRNYKHDIQDKLDAKEDVIQQLQENAQDLKKEMKQQEAELQEKIDSKEIQSQSNILYMQKRIKELSHEIYRIQNQTPNQKLDQLSYISVVKQEFQKVSNEILNLKKFIRTESLEKFGLSEKIRQFEEFEITVYGSILEWEKKTQELIGFAKKQEANMEEQKVNFIKLRDLIKSKDILIEKQKQQLENREQQQRIGVGILKKEIERSHYLMQTDLIEGIKIMDKESEMLSKENYEKSKRFQNFKVEYTQLLDDRDKIQHENLRLIGELEYQKKEINKLDDTFFTFREKIRAILRIPEQGEKGHAQIVPKLEHTIEEQQILKEEVVYSKAFINELQKQAESEKNFLQSRIRVVEEQIDHIQKQSLSKEEEQHVQFLDKETKYLNEISSLEDKNIQFQNETSVRERQFKKLQDKLETSQYECQCMTKEVEKVKAENRELIDRELKTNQEYREIQFEYQRNQDELNRKIEILTVLEKKLENIDTKCRELKEGNREKQQQLDQEKSLNQQLSEENKNFSEDNGQLLERSRILEKENSELYSDLMNTKNEQIKLQDQHKQAQDDIQLYLRQNENLNNAIQEAQDEVQNSQKIINDLSEQLDIAKQKDYEINDLNYQIRGLRANEKTQYQLITELRQKLNPKQAERDTQTSEFGIQEVIFLRDEITKLSSNNQGFLRDSDQLKEIIQRQTGEIERLIEEKRDLENMIENQNHNLKSMRFSNALKENYNTSNPQILQSAGKTPNKGANIMNSNELYTQILQEKENYISRLELEINDTRKDNELLRDKLIQHEVGAFDKNDQSFNLRHGRRSQTTTQSNYNINSMSHNNQVYSTQKGYYVQGSSFKEPILHNNSMQYHI